MSKLEIALFLTAVAMLIYLIPSYHGAWGQVEVTLHTKSIGNTEFRSVQGPSTNIEVSTDPFMATAQCNAEEVVIGGGYGGHIPEGATMIYSAPNLEDNTYQVTVEHNDLLDDTEGFMVAIALCMKPATSP